MKAILIAIVALAMEQAAATSYADFQSAPLAANSVVWLSPDVQMIYHASNGSRMKPKAIQDISQCRAQIALAVCLVDPPKDPTKDGIDRPCLPGGEAYVVPFEALFDRFPLHLQRVFCSLDKIFIEKEFFATAYARLVQDDNQKIIGSGIGVRK